MPTVNSKSTRSYFEYPLKEEYKKHILKIINDKFDSFVVHNNSSLDNQTREKLRRLAVEQLSEYMSELADNKNRWSLDGNIILIRIQSKINRISRNMISKKSDKERRKYRFIQRSNKWEVVYYSEEPKIGISYEDFSKEVYEQMYSAAETAAFYAISSWFGEEDLWRTNKKLDGQQDLQQANRSIKLLKKYLTLRN